MASYFQVTLKKAVLFSIYLILGVLLVHFIVYFKNNSVKNSEVKAMKQSFPRIFTPDCTHLKICQRMKRGFHTHFK